MLFYILRLSLTFLSAKIMVLFHITKQIMLNNVKAINILSWQIWASSGWDASLISLRLIFRFACIKIWGFLVKFIVKNMSNKVTKKSPRNLGDLILIFLLVYGKPNSLCNITLSICLSLYVLIPSVVSTILGRVYSFPLWYLSI